MQFIIENEKQKASVPAGAYPAKFLGYKATTTKSGDALLWEWTITSGSEAGKIASAFTNPPSETPPTVSNALGKILAGLAGRSLTGGDIFDPETCVGKAYTVVVAPGPKGGAACVRTVVPTA